MNRIVSSLGMKLDRYYDSSEMLSMRHEGVFLVRRHWIGIPLNCAVGVPISYFALEPFDSVQVFAPRPPDVRPLTSLLASSRQDL